MTGGAALGAAHPICHVHELPMCGPGAELERRLDPRAQTGKV